MKPVKVSEAESTLSALLDRVEKGEEVLITREGKPIAGLVNPKTFDARAKVLEALERIDAAARYQVDASQHIKDVAEEIRRLTLESGR